MIYDARCATYVNLIHDGLELTVLAVEGTNGGHGRVKVLHVLGVHLEEGRIPHHDVSDPLELCTFAPLAHPGLELGKRGMWFARNRRNILDHMGNHGGNISHGDQK